MPSFCLRGLHLRRHRGQARWKVKATRRRAWKLGLLLACPRRLFSQVFNDATEATKVFTKYATQRNIILHSVCLPPGLRPQLRSRVVSVVVSLRVRPHEVDTTGKTHFRVTLPVTFTATLRCRKKKVKTRKAEHSALRVLPVLGSLETHAQCDVSRARV